VKRTAGLVRGEVQLPYLLGTDWDIAARGYVLERVTNIPQPPGTEARAASLQQMGQAADLGAITAQNCRGNLGSAPLLLRIEDVEQL